jgi:tetratricopeptide (TPR) repeat protein
MQSYGLVCGAFACLDCMHLVARRREFVTSSAVNIEGELAQLASGTIHADEALEVSRRLMALAKGAQWSQATAYHGRALYAQGRIADALTTFEDAWEHADQLDDPVAGALVTGMGGSCCATLYDYAKAEQWCVRELNRPRSRVVANYRFGLVHLLASARMCQGDIAGARELLGEFEGGASNHFLLAFHEGEWERGVVLRRIELEAERAAGRLEGISNCASLLGRFARLANLRDEARAYLDEGLAASLAGPDRNRELFIRVELALLDADHGGIERAVEHLARCREMVEDGEDWRGHRGAVAYTSAMVEAAQCLGRFKGMNLVWAIPAQRNRPLKLPDQVEDGFGAAIEIFRRYHAPWEEASALALWSRVLLAAGHHRQSVEKFNWAFAIFDSLDAPAQLTDRVQAEMFRFMALSSRPAATTPTLILGSNLFRKEGEYWTISFEGSVFRLRDTMGMHYICRLLANPGISFSAQDLAALSHKSNPRRGSKKRPVSARNGAAANDEHDGQYDAARERARLMVTKRIKDVIAKIRLTHPELARHFAGGIRTGYACSYVADDEHSTGWTT